MRICHRQFRWFGISVTWDPKTACCNLERAKSVSVSHLFDCDYVSHSRRQHNQNGIKNEQVSTDYPYSDMKTTTKQNAPQEVPACAAL